MACAGSILAVSRRLGHPSVLVAQKHYADLWSGVDAADREAAVLIRPEDEQDREAEEAGSNVVPFPEVS